MKKIIGKVTEQERDEIQSLFERRNGLNELAKILTAENNELYEKLIKDMGATNTKFQNWWENMKVKYNWEMTENGHWEISFSSCEIFLVND